MNVLRMFSSRFLLYLHFFYSDLVSCWANVYCCKYYSFCFKIPGTYLKAEKPNLAETYFPQTNLQHQRGFTISLLLLHTLLSLFLNN